MSAAMRLRAAAWYAHEAARQDAAGSGTVAAMFRVFSKRIENGDADHRLAAVIGGQAEYDLSMREETK
jgi:hypothetical protein